MSLCLNEICTLLNECDNSSNYFKSLINRLALDSNEMRASTVTCLG